LYYMVVVRLGLCGFDNDGIVKAENDALGGAVTRPGYQLSPPLKSDEI